MNLSNEAKAYLGACDGLQESFETCECVMDIRLVVQGSRSILLQEVYGIGLEEDRSATFLFSYFGKVHRRPGISAIKSSRHTHRRHWKIT